MTVQLFQVGFKRADGNVRTLWDHSHTHKDALDKGDCSALRTNILRAGLCKEDPALRFSALIVLYSSVVSVPGI